MCCGRRDSGGGGGRTKEVGRREVGTLEGMTSVSKDASTRLLVWRFRQKPEAKCVADVDDLACFDGDLWANFALDFERVLRGERRDGPGCGAGACEVVVGASVIRIAEDARGSFRWRCLPHRKNRERKALTRRSHIPDP